MKDFWDKRYSGSEYVYGEAPNVFFEEAISRLPPGKILLAGEGEGRNAVFAARKGWQVDAFDQSSVGREKAMRLAEKAGVQINYELANAPDFKPEGNKYFVIGLIFFHLPPKERKAFHRQCVRALAPGGRIILEAFHKDQMLRSSGGPKNEELLYSLEELYADFQGMEWDIIRKETVFLKEGPHHRGEADVVRMVAVRSMC